MPDGQMQQGGLRNLLMAMRQARMQRGAPMGQEGVPGVPGRMPQSPYGGAMGVPPVPGQANPGQVNPMSRMRLMERLRRRAVGTPRESLGKERIP